MTDASIWLTIIGICGGIITIIGALEKIVSTGKAIGAPAAELTRRVSALEARCNEYERFFHSDKQRLTDLEQALSIMMQAQFALLSHAVDEGGTGTGQLKEARERMLEYLTVRGIKI